MQIDLGKILYAPTLKWKEGEYKGLSELSPHLKDFVLPIFLMPPQGSYDNEEQRTLAPDEHIKLFGARLSEYWGGRFCFIDAGEIDTPAFEHAARGEHPLKALFERSKLSQPRGILAPATALDRSPEYQAATAKILQDNPGIPVCVRLRPEDLEGVDITILIADLLNVIKVKPERAILVLDASELSDWSDPDGLAELLSDLINRLPYLRKWQSLIVSLCSMPSDFNPPPRETTMFDRGDWRVFQALISKEKEGDLLRRPIYSDYCTENATFKPGGGVFPATQLRYTSETEIAVIKGVNTKVGGYKGIFKVAQTIVSNSSFAGASFSNGDFEIATLAEEPNHTGNASSWKKFSINHHLTFVLYQLSNLLGVTVVAPAKAEEREQLDLLV